MHLLKGWLTSFQFVWDVRLYTLEIRVSKWRALLSLLSTQHFVRMESNKYLAFYSVSVLLFGGYTLFVRIWEKDAFSCLVYFIYSIILDGFSQVVKLVNIWISLHKTALKCTTWMFQILPIILLHPFCNRVHWYKCPMSSKMGHHWWICFGQVAFLSVRTPKNLWLVTAMWGTGSLI